MSRLTDIFGRRRIVLPVIHVESHEQVIRNMDLANRTNADGVFLINHAISPWELLEIYSAVRSQYPEWWIGLNCLSLSQQEVFESIPRDVSGVWVDGGRIDERNEDQPEADDIVAARRASGWEGLYFGGVAFKGQRPVLNDNLGTAARIAMRYMDVVTTSGQGTAKAAESLKVRLMKEAIGDFPLAVASGITPENVHDYLDTVDCFLVASGISTSFSELDEDRTRALIDIVRTYEQDGMQGDE